MLAVGSSLDLCRSGGKRQAWLIVLLREIEKLDGLCAIGGSESGGRDYSWNFCICHMNDYY